MFSTSLCSFCPKNGPLSIPRTPPEFRLPKHRVAIASICAYGETEPVRLIGCENHRHLGRSVKLRAGGLVQKTVDVFGYLYITYMTISLYLIYIYSIIIYIYIYILTSTYIYILYRIHDIYVI